MDCEPYGIDANASTMAEFSAAMMRAIAEISVEDYGISSNSNGVKSKRRWNWLQIVFIVSCLKAIFTTKIKFIQVYFSILAFNSESD